MEKEKEIKKIQENEGSQYSPARWPNGIGEAFAAVGGFRTSRLNIAGSKRLDWVKVRPPDDARLPEKSMASEPCAPAGTSPERRFRFVPSHLRRLP
jgi:hypothetical protein